MDDIAVLRAKFLDQEEEDRIHEQSLKVLGDLGVVIHSPSVLKMIKEAGSAVDPKRGIARIPEGLIHESLRKAPKRVSYCARDRRHDFVVPTEAAPFVATNGLGVHVADLETGKDHPSTRKDIAEFSRLADAMDQVDYLWTSLTATEVPRSAHGVHELWVTLQNTGKHVEGVTVQDAADARMQVALASLVAGGPEALRKRPITSIIACPIAPLTFEKGAVEAQVEFARAGVPVLSMSMTLGGMTSPVTLAAMLTNINAENLASLVIDQVAAPGSPHIYTSDSTPVNMTTGHIDYAAVESPMIAAGAAQMAKRYGLPCMTSGWGAAVDEKPGLRAPFSEISGITLSMLSGTDLSAGIGGIDTAKGCSFEQVIIDCYLWEHVRALMRNFKISEETIALDVMKEVGHGNTFLRHPHTARTFRKELFFRDPKKLAWEATLSDRMVSEAREIARMRLKEHEVLPLDRDLVKEGDELIRQHEKQLARR